MVNINDYDGSVRKTFNKLSKKDRGSIRRIANNKEDMSMLGKVWPGMNKEDVCRELVDMAHEYKVKKKLGL